MDKIKKLDVDESATVNETKTEFIIFDTSNLLSKIDMDSIMAEELSIRYRSHFRLITIVYKHCIEWDQHT